MTAKPCHECLIFCSEAVGEGEEVALGNQVYVTRSDNLDQLRRFLGRLLPPVGPENPSQL